MDIRIKLFSGALSDSGKGTGEIWNFFADLRDGRRHVFNDAFKGVCLRVKLIYLQ